MNIFKFILHKLYRLSRFIKLSKKVRWTIFVLLIIVFSFYFLYFRTLDKVEFYAKHYRQIQFVQKLSNIIYLPQSIFSGSKLERYDLIIDSQDLEYLNDNLPQIYANQILTDKYKKTVKAKFIVHNQEYQVKLRYRGDTDIHWRDSKKSWFINFTADQPFEGKDKIHLVIPVDRHYLLEELSFYRAKKMGLMVPDTKLINLFVNGRRHGVYWQFEHWGKEFLESKNIPGDINLYGSKEFDETIGQYPSSFISPHTWSKYSRDLFSGPSNYADLNLLFDIINTPSDIEFKQKIGAVLDLENFYQWQINQYLIASTHQSGANIRFYFDPTKGKFMFIPWDISTGNLPPSLYEYNYNQLVTRILKVPEFLHRRNELLWQYVSDKNNLTDDLNHYDQLDKLTKNDFYKDRLKTESHLAYRRKIKDFRQQIITKFKHIKSNLENAKGFITVETGNQIPVKVIVESNGFSAVLLDKIEIKSDNCSASMEVWQDSNHNAEFDNQDKKIAEFIYTDNIYRVSPNFLVYAVKNDFDGQFLKPGNNQDIIFITADSPDILQSLNKQQLDFTLLNAVSGKKIKNIPVRFIVNNLNFDLAAKNLSAAEFVKKNLIFRLRQGNIALPQGSYSLNKDIIIPANTKLIIDKGTILNLAPKISLISYSPVKANGTAASPIIFRKSYNSPWGVFGIIQAGATSTLEYLIMDSGAEDYINATFMSGMLSIYHSSAVVKNSIFKNAHGDDGLNVKYGYTEISSCQFLNNKFDALDIDVTDSIVANNIFQNNGNDSIDVSSARPIIKNNHIQNSGDKCISLGENTQSLLFNNLLSGCDTGIAVKDLSEPLIVNNTIFNNRIGISAYQKKEIFGGSNPKVINSIIWNNDNSIELDTLSTMDISHSIIKGGFEGISNSGQDPQLDKNYIISQDNPLNQKLNKDIYFQLDNNLKPMEILGYSK